MHPAAGRARWRYWSRETRQILVAYVLRAGVHAVPDLEPEELASVSCRSVVARMFGTRISENPAIIDQIISSARAVDGTANEIATCGSWPCTHSRPSLSNAGKSGPCTRPARRKKYRMRAPHTPTPARKIVYDS